MTEYRITRFTSTREQTFVEADTEEEAEKIAMNLPKKDWEDMSDERFIREYEVEEY
tara:strand:- start:15 stop:182 length:168 start_codon:yes stop_codon:yes gene_type:complete